MDRSLTTVVFFLFASLTLAHNDATFRAGTVTYNGEGVVPSIGTFIVYYGNPSLLTVTKPIGEPLFDVPSPLSTVNFWGSSPELPLSGTYQAVLGDRTLLRTSLDPDNLLPPVENLSVVYQDGVLAVSWTPLAEARTYEVVLHKEGEAGDILARRKIQKGSVTLSTTLGPGGYLVVVRAFNYPTDVLPLPPTNLAVSETLRVLSVQ